MDDVLITLGLVVVAAVVWGVASEYFFGKEADKKDEELGEEGDS